MRFVIDRVPNLTIKQDEKELFNIDSLQFMDEQSDRVIVQCAEHIEDFYRGFVCDIEYTYRTSDANKREVESESGLIPDLLLVHINKIWDVEGYPQFEYVFYK